MRRIVLMVLVLCVLSGIASAAGPDLVVIDPVRFTADIGPVNVGAISAPIRIKVKNIGDAATTPSIELSGGPFVIISSGGSLGPGETAFWDVVAMPTIADLGGNAGFFDVTYTNANDDDVMLTVFVTCQVRRTPFDAPIAGFARLGPGTTASRTITVTNTSATPQTITRLTLVSPTVFTVQLHAGSLPITVPSEGTFDIEVTFAPTLPDHGYDSEIDATLSDGSSVYVSETFGATTGILSLESTANLIWDGVPLGATWVRHGVLVNYGDTPQTITALVLSNPTEFGFTGIRAGTVIPAHASVALDVTFTPGALATRFSTFTISSTSAADILDLVSGEGVTPLVQITTDDAAAGDGVLDFGALELGSAPVTRQLTITNISRSAISTNRCEQFFDDDYTATADCPDFVVLAPGASLQFGVTFTPAHLGDHAGRITFSANGMNYTLEMRVYGRVTLHSFALSKPMLAFADTVRYPAAPPTLDIVLTNNGAESMAIPDAAIDGAGFGLVASPPLGMLASGQSVTYTVGFAPTAAGDFDGRLVLGPPANPVAAVPLHGTGTLRPVSAEAELDLGAVAVGDLTRGSITVHNAGSVALAVTGLATSDRRFVVSMPADPTVPAGGDLTIDVEYAPSVRGADDATLSIAFDHDPDPQLTVALRGEGLVHSSGGCSAHGGGGNALLVLGLGMLVSARRRRPALARNNVECAPPSTSMASTTHKSGTRIIDI